MGAIRHLLIATAGLALTAPPAAAAPVLAGRVAVELGFQGGLDLALGPAGGPFLAAHALYSDQVRGWRVGLESSPIALDGATALTLWGGWGGAIHSYFGFPEATPQGWPAPEYFAFGARYRLPVGDIWLGLSPALVIGGGGGDIMVGVVPALLAAQTLGWVPPIVELGWRLAPGTEIRLRPAAAFLELAHTL